MTLRKILCQWRVLPLKAAWVMFNILFTWMVLMTSRG